MLQGIHRRSVALCTVIVPALAALALGCQQRASEPQAQTTETAVAATPLERGRYLTAVLACNDCHTPMAMGPEGPAPDMTRMLSGHPENLVMPPPPQLPEGPWAWVGAITNTAFSGPWGVTYAPNLTPDQNTGLGIWTEEMFVTAMKTGKHMGTSRAIQPPMPWPAYQHLTDEDLKAIYAYLRSVPPIPNRVPDYAPPAGS